MQRADSERLMRETRTEGFAEDMVRFVAAIEDAERARLRDCFAVAALGAVSSIDMLQGAGTEEDCELCIVNAAALAYRLADAMLVARARRLA